jgi:coenzyme Q-binding protein COQ10
MPQFKTTRRVAVPPDVAFKVAADVSAYKDFLPLLEKSSIRGSVTESGTFKSFNAELAVGYAKLNLHESFISKVVCDATARTVTATSQDAPFKNMKTVWAIRDVHGQSEVEIFIDYAMRSLLIQFAVSGAMEMAVNKIMSAFETRAVSLHNASMII